MVYVDNLIESTQTEAYNILSPGVLLSFKCSLSLFATLNNNLQSFPPEPFYSSIFNQPDIEYSPTVDQVSPLTSDPPLSSVTLSNGPINCCYPCFSLCIKSTVNY